MGPSLFKVTGDPLGNRLEVRFLGELGTAASRAKQLLDSLKLGGGKFKEQSVRSPDNTPIQFFSIRTNLHVRSERKFGAKHCLTSSNLILRIPTLPYRGLRQRFGQTKGHFVLSKLCQILKLRFLGWTPSESLWASSWEQLHLSLPKWSQIRGTSGPNRVPLPFGQNAGTFKVCTWNCRGLFIGDPVNRHCVSNSFEIWY